VFFDTSGMARNRGAGLVSAAGEGIEKTVTAKAGIAGIEKTVTKAAVAIRSLFMLALQWIGGT